MQTQQSPEDLALRYQSLLRQIRELSLDQVAPAELLAVSKGQPVDRIRELAKLGQRRFGENYAQELWTKARQLKDLDIEWVYIGHLQSNKIRRLVATASEIQTLSQWSHAELIARAAADCHRVPYPVYIEVKVDEKPGKSGANWSETLALATRVQKELPELRLRGLMAVPPTEYQDSTYQAVPELYRRLRALADRLGDRLLSLGMSGDLRLALEAGSNQVRIGRALLGERLA